MKQQSQTGGGWKRHIRGLLVGLLIGVSCLALSALVVVHWAERQILTTDNWVALVSPLPKQPVVSNALGSYVSDQVFSAVPVQQKIADALPPRAAFLAGPLSSQLKTITTNAARKLVASDGFQTIWAGANRVAMDRLVTTARGQEPAVKSRLNQKFDIDISQVSAGLQKALGSAANALPALQPAADKAQAIDISTDLKARPHRLHQVVRTIDTLSVVLPLLVVTGLLLALAFSSHRRRTALAFAIVTIILMLTELVAIKWLRQQTLDQVTNQANVPAVSYIYDTLVGWLRQMIGWVLVFATLGVGGLLLGGPANWAVSARRLVHLDRLHASSAMVKWRQARAWTAQWKHYLWLGVVLVVLICVAAFVSVNGRAVLNAGLLTISLCAAVQIVASPPHKAVVAARQAAAKA